MIEYTNMRKLEVCGPSGLLVAPGSILHPLIAGCRYDACNYDACPPAAAAAAPPIENMVKFRYKLTIQRARRV